MPTLVVRVLGGCSATIDGGDVRFEYDKVRAVLAYVAMSPPPVSRPALAALLWPEQTESAAAVSLRQALARLRRALGEDEAGSQFLSIDRDFISLRRGENCQVDAHEFELALAFCDAHRHRHAWACPRCADQLDAALSFYEGPFLHGLRVTDSVEFDDWVSTWRESLQVRAIAALESRLRYAELRSDFTAARMLSSRLLHMDPLHEAAHASVLRQLADTGQRTQAARYFIALRARLRAELGIEPAAELRHIAEAIARTGPSQPKEANRIPGLAEPVAPLVGRRAELQSLVEWIAETRGRVATITGPGGVGKSRLAMEVLRSESPAFRDGGLFVTVENSGDQWADELSRVRGRDVLVVLDGCEQGLAMKPRLDWLLRENPGLVILATSRVPLGLEGETVFSLAGLRCPSSEDDGRAAEYESVELFMQTAGRVAPGFIPGEAERAGLGEICRLLGGLPLGINLAAGWVGTIPCREIAMQIGRSLALMNSGSQSADPHASLAAVFDQSLGLLDERERAALPRLAVFRGGFDAAAAASVAAADLPTLRNLGRKSFLHATAAGRFQLHEVFRRFAWEMLDVSEERPGIQRRHYEYYLASARSHDDAVRSSLSLAGFHWLVVEQPNLLAALEWARTVDAETVERLTSVMHRERHNTGVHIMRPAAVAP